MFIKCFNSAKQASKVDEDKLTGEIAPKILHPTGENIVKISSSDCCDIALLTSQTKHCTCHWASKALSALSWMG